MDEIKDVELKSFDNLIDANDLRDKIMELVPRVWVLVKNPKPNDSTYKVSVMNVWGSSPSKEQLEECNKLAN